MLVVKHPPVTLKMKVMEEKVISPEYWACVVSLLLDDIQIPCASQKCLVRLIKWSVKHHGLDISFDRIAFNHDIWRVLSIPQVTTEQ